MKKLLKRILVLTIAVATFVFAGCFGSPKTFSKEGMSIELTDQFVEKEYISMTCYYESPEMIVTVLKEEFSLNPSVESWTLTKYAQTVVSVNGLTDVEISKSEQGYAFFEYSKTVSGKDYTYFATCHKSEDAFWLIQFACFTKNYDSQKSNMEKYADSITFGTSSTSVDGL